ncbi:sigma-54-dependent Fis family transcriptional regulator [Hoeflea sp. TYP-13]|uniref:sigma-54-dependent Fis family transcriptional regulator n=1 Tax=Hoeflea sp. TYP-13 TaxID=3230023 RepID=UPI0034C5FDB2
MQADNRIDPGRVMKDQTCGAVSGRPWAAGCGRVEASWERCANDYGLDPGARLRNDRFGNYEVTERLQAIEKPLVVAAPLIEKVRRVARDAGYCVIIADNDCAAVVEYCDSAAAKEIKSFGISAGTVWDEPFVGTNGIGTSIADNKIATVNGNQHYHTAFKKFICSAAPLIDHEGRTFAALNLSGKATDSASEVALLARLIKRSTGNIHNYLFRNYFRNHHLVALSTGPFYEPHDYQAMVAISETGEIVGATNPALGLIGMDDRDSVIGKSLEATIGLGIDDLAALKGRVHRTETDRGEGRYVRFFRPQAARGGSKSAIGSATKAESRNSRQPGKLTLDRIAGNDSRLEKTINLCRKLIDSDIPFLVQGETGVGKDVFAGAVHASSKRAAKPFVAVNCAAIPDSLLDSELFGYAPGTFTGALKSGKVGQIVAADKGTLFLDEIGDMPMESQTRLLRVLSDRTVTPVGATKPVSIDIKLICATHRDLDALVAEGKFREDLYYRICGARFELPALREREDFGEVVNMVMEKTVPGAGGLSFSEDAWQIMGQYNWPGNIRQLKNVLQYVSYSCANGHVLVDDLPEDVRRAMRSGFTSGVANRSANTVSGRRSGSMQFDGSAPEIGSEERDRIVAALQQAKWRVTEAAANLGVSRATLHRHMNRYGIIRPDHR